MEQSGYISEWQNLLLTLTSYYYSINIRHQEEYLAMEIERKFLIQKLEELPFSPFDYPHKELEQGDQFAGRIGWHYNDLWSQWRYQYVRYNRHACWCFQGSGSRT